MLPDPLSLTGLCIRRASSGCHYPEAKNAAIAAPGCPSQWPAGSLHRLIQPYTALRRRGAAPEAANSLGANRVDHAMRGSGLQDQKRPSN